MKRIISTWIVLFGVWMALAGFSVEELIVGLTVTLILSVLISKTQGYDFGFKVVVQVVQFIVIYLPYFIYKLIEANISLAKIVLDPKLPINPGFVTIQTGLEEDLAKLTLANSITLTPGTLTVDVDGQDILIHWVDIQGNNQNDYFKNIAGGFEKRIGGMVK